MDKILKKLKQLHRSSTSSQGILGFCKQELTLHLNYDFNNVLIVNM